jgi:hypothetical protein
MTLLESFCANIEDELGHTPLVEAAQMAAFVLLNDEPIQLEGFGDFMKSLGRKVGKAAAIGALAFNAANANAAPVNKHQASNPNLANHKQTTKVCSATVRNAWSNPLYQDLETKYLQEEIDKQKQRVEAGKQARVDEQRAYRKAQMRAMNDIACAAN